MSVPPPPPRPAYGQNNQGNQNPNAPPVPPLPPGFRPEIDGIGDSPPHFVDPLVAPRPQKLMSSVPAEMAKSLESQMAPTPAPMVYGQPPQQPYQQVPPPPGAYGQPVPAFTFSNAPPQPLPQPGAYPPAPYPPAPYPPAPVPYGNVPNANINPAFRGASPMPYPGTPQPFQLQQQQAQQQQTLPYAQPGFAPTPPMNINQRPVSMAFPPQGTPAPGFTTPPRIGPSPAPYPVPGGPSSYPGQTGLTPGFVSQRPQSWGGPPPNMPGLSSAIIPPPVPATPQPLQQLGVSTQQSAIPNPNWVNGATPPHSRSPSAAGGSVADRHNITNSLSGLTFNEPAPKSAGPAQLVVQLPTVITLTTQLNGPSGRDGVLTSRDPMRKVAWCKDVLLTLERSLAANSEGGATSGGSAKEILLGPSSGSTATQLENDAALIKLSETAVSTIMALLSPPLPQPGPGGALQPYIAESLFLRGTVIAGGWFPERLPKSARDAFRDFENAARGGYSPAWFKLGRDYEVVGDQVRAKECFERGVQRGVGSCFYRMGMAHLQGQLGLQQNPTIAMPLLQRAAYLASIEVAQPAYVYALLLLGEFPHVHLPEQLLQSLVPPPAPFVQTFPPTAPPPAPTLMSESRKYLERSAYLNFGPALYKLGQSYEHALPPFPYDPLMSVQYYSLASQQGDALADLALSKWFLVGSHPVDPSNPGAQAALASGEGFEKDESLALIFAEKAASKGEAGGEFAMGYYSEIGIGRAPNLDEARRWYERAAKHGNDDAKARLKELAKETPKLLGTNERKEHEVRLERVRTSARQRAQQAQAQAGGNSLVPPVPSLPGQTGTQAQAATPAPAPAHSNSLAPSSAAAVAMARKSSMINHTPGAGRRNKLQDYERMDSLSAAKPANTNAASAAATTTGESTAAAGKGSNQPKPQPAPQAPSKPVASHGGKGPATFAEMGYHSQKLEEEKCVIM